MAAYEQICRGYSTAYNNCFDLTARLAPWATNMTRFSTAKTSYYQLTRGIISGVIEKRFQFPVSKND